MIDSEFLAPILKMLKEELIHYIVAPNDSISQLVYLQKIGYINEIYSYSIMPIFINCESIYIKKQNNADDFCQIFKHGFHYSRINLKNVLPLGCRNAMELLALLSQCEDSELTPEVCYQQAQDIVAAFKIFHKATEDYIEDLKIKYNKMLYAVVYNPKTTKRIYLSCQNKAPDNVRKYLGELDTGDHNAKYYAQGQHILNAVLESKNE